MNTTNPSVLTLNGVVDDAWRILDGAGDTARFSSGEEASGGTWGWHAGFGVNLLLDYFSPTMASDFNRDAGVNNSYFRVSLSSSGASPLRSPLPVPVKSP